MAGFDMERHPNGVYGHSECTLCGVSSCFDHQKKAADHHLIYHEPKIGRLHGPASFLVVYGCYIYIYRHSFQCAFGEGGHLVIKDTCPKHQQS